MTPYNTKWVADAHLPWTLDVFEGRNGLEFTVQSADGGTVCTFYAPTREVGEQLGAVIAAAPELLEALKVARAFIADQLGLSDSSSLGCLLEVIEAAIAKAVGTSPGRADQSSDPAAPTEAKS